MKEYLYFGEQIEGYAIPVLNEREARAAAGILFMFGMISFFNAYLVHDFRLTQIFVTVFMMDFFIRIFINPKYAPSMILARLFVRHQTPEYVGAPQKRWAWSIGLALAVVMFFIIVIFEWMTPIKIAICILCLLLLFSEAAFGICIGCKLYHALKRTARYCPGGTCEVMPQQPIQTISRLQILILVVSMVLIGSVSYRSFHIDPQKMMDSNRCGAGKCATGKCGGR